MDLQDWEQRHKAETIEKPAFPFVTRITEKMPPGRALDLACGTGRHALWLAREGWTVTAVDGSAAAIGILRGRAGGLRIKTHIADLELHRYSIAPGSWDLILISLYLQRDLFEPAKAGVKPGGVLIAITLLAQPGKSPQHCLQPGELEAFFAGWEILDRFEGREGDPGHVVAKIAARKLIEGG